MRPLQPENSSELREYLLRYELDAFMMISHLNAQGIGPVRGKVRAGEYYKIGGAVLAIYPNDTAFAFMPDGRAPEQFAKLLSGRRIKRLYATPISAAAELDGMVKGKEYRFALSEIGALQCGVRDMPMPEGFSLQKLDPNNDEGFRCLTGVYNAAQDEHASARDYQEMAGAMSAPEGFYLGRYLGEPCLSMAAEARTPNYIYISSAGVTESMRGRGFAQAALSCLCGEAAKYDLRGLILVAEDNRPSQRVMEKCGYRYIDGKKWLIVWYEP